jgi:hypothetical protein
VPNEWFESFALPIGDRDVLGRDPDRDGFTNLEEWEHHTDPNDKSSHPLFITKLKLMSIGQEPFRLVFSSRVGETFAINTNDFNEPTQFLKVGDSVKGTKFRLITSRDKYEVNHLGTRIDTSELVLENEETREEITLVKEKAMISPRIIGRFRYSWSKEAEFSAGKDEQFSLEPEEQTTYRVIDLQAAKATIIDTEKPNDLIEIALLNP